MGTIYWTSEQIFYAFTETVRCAREYPETLLGRKCLLGLTEDLLTTSLGWLSCTDPLVINSVFLRPKVSVPTRPDVEALSLGRP